MTKIPKKRWRQAISADGTDERESGEVAEITDLVDLSLWGEGTRMIVRRELPHPGAQLTFSDVEADSAQDVDLPGGGRHAEVQVPDPHERHDGFG